MNREQILKEFDETLGWTGEEYVPTKNTYKFIINLASQTREETIREEIDYWKDVFDNRPKDRDLESDNIAQNFARIEIERLENKLKKYETIRTI